MRICVIPYLAYLFVVEVNSVLILIIFQHVKFFYISQFALFGLIEFTYCMYIASYMLGSCILTYNNNIIQYNVLN